jgi:hypothetical protein
MIEVNSARRRERIAKEVSKRFGSTATLIETTTVDIVKELQDRRARRGTKIIRVPTGSRRLAAAIGTRLSAARADSR